MVLAKAHARRSGLCGYDVRHACSLVCRIGGSRRVSAQAAYMDKRLHLLCYIPTPDGIRVISFRKTNKREAKLYGKPQNID
jgi:uncharacterized DUF497 family protein